MSDKDKLVRLVLVLATSAFCFYQGYMMGATKELQNCTKQMNEISNCLDLALKGLLPVGGCK